MSAPSDLASRLRQETGLNVARCYQCGKCSAGCPMAEESTLRPHDVMRLAARNEAARIFEDESIWLCLTCETCSARCPNGVEPARVIDALRAMGEGTAPRPIRAFHESFLGQIRRNGRVHEIGLVAAYKMKSLQLTKDVTTAPGMLRRGKLPLFPARVKGLAQLRRLFENCEKDAAPHGEEGR